MKLRKLVCAGILTGVGVFSLASCGDNGPAKAQMVDADGNTVDVELAATSEKEEVAKVLETLVNLKTDAEALKNINGFTATAKADIDIAFTSTAYSGSLKGNGEARLAALKDDNEVLKFEASVKANASSTYTMLGETATINYNYDVSAFNQDKKLYVKSDSGYNAASSQASQASEAKFADSFDYSAFFESEMVKQYMEQIQAITNDASEATTTAKQYIAEGLEKMGYTEAEIEAYIEGGYLKISDTMHSALLEEIDALGITIVSTTSQTITVGFNADLFDNEKKEAVQVTISVKTLLPTAIKASLGEGIAASMFGDKTTFSASKFDVELSVDYAASIGSHDTNGYTEKTSEGLATDIKKLIPVSM